MPPQTPWIRLARSTQLFLHDGGCLQSVLRQTKGSDTKYPALVLIIDDRRSKLSRLLFADALRPAEEEGHLASLTLDKLTISSRFPTLVSSMALRPRLTANLSLARSPLPPNLTATDDLEVVKLVQNSLLLPFANVICITSTSSKSIQSLIDSVEELHDRLQNSPPWASPGELILFHDDGIKQFSFAQVEAGLKARGLLNRVHLISTTTRKTPPRTSLNKIIASTRAKQADRYRLYSSKQFEDIWGMAVDAFIRGAFEEFNPFRTMRLRESFNTCLGSNLREFVKQSREHSLPQAFVSRHVSSALLFNAYPPGMHSKFGEIRSGEDLTKLVSEPTAIFKDVYEPSCLQAFYGQDIGHIEYSELRDDVLSQFISGFNTIDQGGLTAHDLHKASVRTGWRYWPLTKSKQWCFYCLDQRAEHFLGCQHSLCDNCLQIEAYEASEESVFVIDKCPLCSRQNTYVGKVKPSTAGARILSIDGGGIGGAIPLAFLSVLQNRLGEEMLIQDVFDMAFGTSSGGLIVLSMFQMGWHISRCDSVFSELSQSIFATQGPFPNLVKLWRLAFHDGCYSSKRLDHVLQETFTCKATMTDSRFGQVQGQKIAVTASDIIKADTYLITNYNGPRRDEDGYKIFRSVCPDKEPLVWQSARATSAAPSYFSSTAVSCEGPFQDGGLRANNPTRLALWESKRLWGAGASTDMVLSFGTGTYEEGDEGNTSAPTSSGFLFRLLRYIQHSTDGRRIHNELVRELPASILHNYFRYDCSLPRRIPLDSAKDLEFLKESAALATDFFDDLDGLLLRILTHCFYITIESYSEQACGTIFYMAKVHCRSKARDVIASLCRNFGSIRVAFSSGSSVQLEPYMVCEKCGKLNLSFTGSATSIRENLDAVLHTETGLAAHLSSCPRTLDWFLQRQKEARRVTSYRQKLSCTTCDRKRRRSQSSSPPPAMRRKTKR